MLGLIVSYCPETIRFEIERKATSLKWIWQRVRRHYGFSKSESHFLKLSCIKLNEGERYESFFQRIMSHLYDNLLTSDSGITFDGVPVTANEEMSPTVERLAVFLWLRLIDERLPSYVSRVYSHDLQYKSVKDLQPEICQNLESILMELSTQEDIKIAYSKSGYNSKNSSTTRNFVYQKSQKVCAFCKACKKPYTGHSINDCWSLSKFDRSQIAKDLQINDDDDVHEELVVDVNNVSLQTSHLTLSNSSSLSRVHCMQSPHFYCFYQNAPCKVTIDSGAESNIVSLSFVKANNVKMRKATQHARQLDKSIVKICGEINIDLSFGNIVLPLTALVVESMDSDILAGVPFCHRNNIEFSFAKQVVYIQGKAFPYGTQLPSNVRYISTILCNTLINGHSSRDSLDVENCPFVQDDTEINKSYLDPLCTVEDVPFVVNNNKSAKIPSEVVCNHMPTAFSSKSVRKLAANLIHCNDQIILVVTDNLTSFTTATFLTDKTDEEFKNGLVLCCLPLGFDHVRVDCASGLLKFAKFNSIAAYDIIVDIGREKLNKDPTAAHVHQELENELLKLNLHDNNSLSGADLLKAVYSLNARIRSNGVSSKQMLTVTRHNNKTPENTLLFMNKLDVEEQEVNQNKIHAIINSRTKEKVIPSSDSLSDYEYT